MNSHNRITVLIGAGATVDATKASTKEITKKVLKNCLDLEKKEGGIPSITIFICREYYKLQKGNSTLPRANAIEPYLSCLTFEDFFNVLELMYGYSFTGVKEHTSPHKIFTQWKEQIDGFGDGYRDAVRVRLLLLMRKVVDTINDTVAAYDGNVADYYRDFFRTIERECGCRFDIFNLNYDTWPQKVFEDYNDGFSEEIFRKDGSRYPFRRFHPEVYLRDNDLHHIASMHGSIVYGYPEFGEEDINRYVYDEPNRAMYKYDDYKRAESFRKRSANSQGSTQMGESYYPSNVITGLMKTDKVVESPLNTYLHGFYKALEQNEKLIIVGYGFSDIYINAALDMYLQAHRNKHKTLVIGYVEKKNWSRYAYDGFLGKSIYYTMRLFKDQDWYARERDDLMLSDDKMSCYCPMGFRAMKSKDRLKKICKFLDENNWA